MSEERSRSLNYNIQIRWSVLFKVGTMLSYFLALPIMVAYLGAEQFGVWATMLTLVTWVMIFDLGVGNGLKNKIAENIAIKQMNKAQSYVSTAYGLTGGILLIIYVVLIVLCINMPMQKVFNTSLISEMQLKYSVSALLSFILLGFWLSLINQIYHGLQKSSYVSFGQFLSNFISLFLVSLLYFFFEPSLIFLVICYGISNLLSSLILTFIVQNNYPNLFPKIDDFDKNKIRALFTLGGKFFLVQIAFLVIFMTDKILITQYLGPEHVTDYETVFRLFSIFTVAQGLMLTPLWTAYTDAYHKKDFSWIRAKLIFQLKIVFMILLFAIILALIAPWIIDIWMLGEIKPDKSLIWMMVLFIFISTWNNVFAYYQNAVNDLNLQFFICLFIPFLNIALSIYFLLNGFGTSSVVIASIVSLGFYSIFRANFCAKRA